MPLDYDAIVRDLLLSTAQTINLHPDQANERYLHHHFSQELRQRGLVLDVTGRDRSTLHPEWPTWKKQSKIEFARYQGKKGKNLMPVETGTSGGKIDFALGAYDWPTVGVEAWSGNTWNKCAIMDDLFKVLDPRNPFQVAVSFSVILRPGNLAQGAYLSGLEDGIAAANADVRSRLQQLPLGRPDKVIRFVITEVARNGERRHWSLCDVNGTFERGLTIP